MPPWLEQQRGQRLWRVGRASEALGSFTLDDQVRLIGRGRVVDQPSDYVGCPGKRYVAEDLVGGMRQLEPQEVVVNDLYGRVSRELGPQNAGKLAVQLHGCQPPAPTCKLSGEDGPAGAYFDYGVVGRDRGLSNKASREGTAPKEVLR